MCFMLCSVLGSVSSFIMPSAKDDTRFYERNIFKIESFCLFEKADEGQRRLLGMLSTLCPLDRISKQPCNSLLFFRLADLWVLESSITPACHTWFTGTYFFVRLFMWVSGLKSGLHACVENILTHWTLVQSIILMFSNNLNSRGWKIRDVCSMLSRETSSKQSFHRVVPN